RAGGGEAPSVGGRAGGRAPGGRVWPAAVTGAPPPPPIGTITAASSSQPAITGAGLNQPRSSNGKLVSKNGRTSSAGSTVSRARSRPAVSRESVPVRAGTADDPIPGSSFRALALIFLRLQGLAGPNHPHAPSARTTPRPRA